MKTKMLIALAVLSQAASLAACSGQATGALGKNQEIAKTCPHGSTLAVYAAVDASGSDSDITIAVTREAAIRDIATRVADCSGHLRVVAFSAGAASTATVFDGDLQPTGATQIARLRRVPSLIDRTMTAIDDALPKAEQSVTKNGSDVVSQFRLAGEYVEQLNAVGKHQLDLQLLTDGAQTTGVILNSSKLTNVVAADLASKMPVNLLPAGSTVKVSGLGKTAGAPPPTSYVDALKTFYADYCLRSGATCQVVTDYEGS